MKKKDTKRTNSEFDKFDRKQKKHAVVKQKDSKSRYAADDDFDEDELENLYHTKDDEDFEDD